MTAQEFIALTTKVVSHIGWTDTYYSNLNDSQQEALRIVIIRQAKKHKVTHAMIVDAYPNEGTYTYTDGIVDFTLGALTPMTQVVIDMVKMGVVVAI